MCPWARRLSSMFLPIPTLWDSVTVRGLFPMFLGLRLIWLCSFCCTSKETHSGCTLIGLRAGTWGHQRKATNGCSHLAVWRRGAWNSVWPFSLCSCGSQWCPFSVSSSSPCLLAASCCLHSVNLWFRRQHRNRITKA